MRWHPGGIGVHSDPRRGSLGPPWGLPGALGALLASSLLRCGAFCCFLGVPGAALKQKDLSGLQFGTHFGSENVVVGNCCRSSRVLRFLLRCCPIGYLDCRCVITFRALRKKAPCLATHRKPMLFALIFQVVSSFSWPPSAMPRKEQQATQVEARPKQESTTTKSINFQTYPA